MTFTVYFDSALMMEEGRTEVNDVAVHAKKLKSIRICVIGCMDTSGPNRNNTALSERRTEAGDKI